MSVDPNAAKAIFMGALDRPDPAERAAYVARACGDDEMLRRRVQLLLRAHGDPGNFLESPPAVAGAAADGLNQECAGAVIGPYKLLEHVGEGGMGTVWMAQQTEPVKRVVALKLIKPGMDSRQVVARFEAERQALALMDHPHIARVLDAGTTDTGRPYFVMDLVKGVPITRYCDEHRLTPRQRLALFIPVCQAVQHAHQKGVIHRDLKPSNVLVARYDGRPVPKVIDFGVAKAAGQPLTDKTLVTGFGAIVGTLEYMSPEQAELNQLDIDTRSDTYSLGVLLYELLTGTTPLHRKRIKETAFVELLRIIREEEPQKPSTRLSSTEELPSIAAQRHTEPAKLTKLVRGELDWIVMKALEKDRKRRYQTANGLAMDVRRYLNDEPVQACPPSAGYRLRKFARRNKASLSVAASVFVAMTVMAASVGWAVRDRLARHAEDERAEVVRRAKVEDQARDSLNVARTLVAENKLASAREKLAHAKARLGSDGPALGSLSAEIARGEAELDRFQQFLNLIDQANQVQLAPRAEFGSADDSLGKAKTSPPADSGGRRPAAAVSFLRESLQRYAVLEDDIWTDTLEGGLLGTRQVEQIRRLVYEGLLWLADDVLRRQQDHGTGQTLTPEAAGRQALVYLDRAEKNRRPTQALHLLRVRCYEILKEDAPAQAYAERARQSPPTAALDYFLRGQAAYEARQLAEGVQAFEAALRLEPTRYWSLMKLGFCLCDLGRGPEDYSGAVRVFTGCILKRPDHAHAYYCRAIAYCKLRRYEESVADNSRAIELDPQHAPAWSVRGVAHSRWGRPAQAFADYSKAIDLDPTDPAVWFNRGLAHNQLDQAARAIDDFTKAIELNPTFAPAWRNRGLAHKRLGKASQALADFTKAIELDPTYMEAWYSRGLAHHAQRRARQAVDDYTRAIGINPNYATAYENRGVAYSSLNEWNQSAADLSRALELDPSVASAWFNRGVAYHRLGKPAEAVADCDKAIELAPNAPRMVEVYLVRARAHQQLSHYGQAVADFQLFLKRVPSHHVAHGILARLLATCPDAKVCDPGRAVESAKKAVELAPKVGIHWTWLGVAHYRAGDWTAAVAALDRSLKLRSVGAPIDRLFLAMAHQKLGNHEEARNVYEQAVQWQETHKEALGKNKEMMEELRRFRNEAEEVLELTKK
jgi:tetratricopeptide (TPR) repeat protein/serine/threonine protein kinase